MDKKEKRLNLEEIKIARRCLNYQMIKCNNKDCLNKSCPLNVEYDLPADKGVIE